ncbi:hypothetical protein NKH48_29585, partial [Mesorhizobium sp. M1233]|uniref:hypothetical protein n=1 Tax=Mesorhizobium sp. M1233 TaxID=2957072 RepID=UPI00333987C6
MARAARHPETRDVWPGALLAFAAGLLLLLAATVIVLGLGFDTRPFGPLPGPSSVGNRASPALQRFPEDDLAAFRKAEEQELNKVGWVDRTAGIARIPIEDAMWAIVSHGLPNWGQPAPAPRAGGRLVAAEIPRAPTAARSRPAPRAGGPPG